MPTARERWFADVLRAGLETKVLTEADILGHATPAVLTAALPKEVMVRVIETTLASGTMSHKAVIDVVTLELLGEKVPPDVIWSCIEGAAERTGIRDGIPKDEASAREFLRRALDAGLTTAAITPKDIVHYVTAQVLCTTLPDALTIKLIETSLQRGKMNPELVVETIGTQEIAKHVSTAITYAIFGKLAASSSSAKSGTVTAAAPKKPQAAVLEDDNVLVELVADLEADVKAKPAPKQPAR